MWFLKIIACAIAIIPFLLGLFIIVVFGIEGLSDKWYK